MSYLNKIVITLLILITFGCNITTSNESSKKDGTVNISIPNISPRILESLSKNNSRGFNVIDKIVLKVSKDNITTEYINNLTLNEDKQITLILEEGDYQISADIYNLKVSETEPVVTGQGDITIIPGTSNTLKIILTPHNPLTIEEDTEVTITDIVYTEYSYTLYEDLYTDWVEVTDEFGDSWWEEQKVYKEFWDEELIATGKEYWYEFTATEDVTKVTLLTQTLSSPPALISVYDSNGLHLNSIELFSNYQYIRTPKGEKFYISVLPVKTISDGIENFSEAVSFKISPFTASISEDLNYSPDTAEYLGFSNYISGDFDAIVDVDYYIFDVSIDTIIYFSGIDEECDVRIIDDNTEIIMNNNTQYTTTSNFVMVKVTNISMDDNVSYSFNYNTIIPPLEADAYESGFGDNSESTATELIIGEAQHDHNIHDGSDIDFYSVNLTEGVTYEFETFYNSGRDMDTKLYLYDLNSAEIAYNDDYNSGYYSKITYTATYTGVYYLKVIPYGSSTGDYSLVANQI